MPTKTRKKVSSKQSTFEFKPWHAFVIIALVVITGYIVVRFSRASSNGSPEAVANVQADFSRCSAMAGNGPMPTISGGEDNDCVRYIRRFFRDIAGDGTAEEGPMDPGMVQKIRDFQEAINFGISGSIYCGVVPGIPCTLMQESTFNDLKSKGLINQGATYQRELGAPAQTYVDKDGIVGPMTWGWINTITYVYFCGNNGPCYR